MYQVDRKSIFLNKVIQQRWLGEIPYFPRFVWVQPQEDVDCVKSKAYFQVKKVRKISKKLESPEMAK